MFTALISNFLRLLNVVFFLLGNFPENYPEERILPAYEDGTDSAPKRRHIKFRLQGIIQKRAYYLPKKMEQSVPKRRHIKFRLQGIIQKKAYYLPKKMEVFRNVGI